MVNQTSLVQYRCRNIDNFQKLSRIGAGTYGLVYKAIDKLSNKTVALKRIIMHNEKSDGFPVTTIREIKTLQEASSHPNCVKLHEIAVGKNTGVGSFFEFLMYVLGT